MRHYYATSGATITQPVAPPLRNQWHHFNYSATTRHNIVPVFFEKVAVQQLIPNEQKVAVKLRLILAKLHSVAAKFVKSCGELRLNLCDNVTAVLAKKLITIMCLFHVHVEYGLTVVFTLLCQFIYTSKCTSSYFCSLQPVEACCADMNKKRNIFEDTK